MHNAKHANELMRNVDMNDVRAYEQIENIASNTRDDKYAFAIMQTNAIYYIANHAHELNDVNALRHALTYIIAIVDIDFANEYRDDCDDCANDHS